MITVSPIPPELTYDIRHIVLREGLPRESCYWETDRAEGVFHLGAWIGTRLAGIATFQPEPYPTEGAALPDGVILGENPYRLRGMAVLPEFRGEGVGGLMLLAGEDRLRQQGIEFLWCDARLGALGFYEQYGWKITGETFHIPTAGPHKRMYKVIHKLHSCCAGRSV